MENIELIVAKNNAFMSVLSGSLYMVVSNMLINSQNGTYIVNGYTFSHLYLNFILVSFIYIIVSVSLCLFISHRHEYKLNNYERKNQKLLS
ncbi:MAG: hypothetical protein ACI31G_02900 [Bacilli bacterium]